MRHNEQYASDDVEVVRELVRAFPWGLLVSHTDAGLVASHYPFLLAPESLEPGSPLVLHTHVGRPDDRVHAVPSANESMVVVQGHHGYVSPNWYSPGSSLVPTWNFTAAHLYGVPEPMDDSTNLAALNRLVAHFEQHVDDRLRRDAGWADASMRGTVGLRLPVDRFVAKVKLSQDKDEASVAGVIEHLSAPGPYSHPDLADDMRRAHPHLAGPTADRPDL